MKKVFNIATMAAAGVFAVAGMAHANTTSNSGGGVIAGSAVTQSTSSAAAQVASSGTSSAAGSIGSGGGAVGTGTQSGALQLLGGNTGLAAAAASRGIGLWTQGSWTRAESTFNGGTNNDMRFKGDIWVGMVGADYRLTQRFVVGMAGGYQNVDISTTFNAGKLKQTGWGVTPYAVFALNQTYFIDVTAGYWWLENEMNRNSNTAKATYDGKRWNLGANLNGGWSINRWRATAAVGYLYVNAEDDAYRETGSAAQAAVQKATTVRIGQGRIGGTLGYSLGNVTPYAMARVEHNFEQPKVTLNNATGLQPNANRTGYRVGGGLNFNLSPAISGNLGGNYLLGKTDYKEYGVNGTIRVSF